MREGRWVTVTESEFDHEHRGLEAVRKKLPDSEPWRAWSNFTFTANTGHVREVDLLVGPRRNIDWLRKRVFVEPVDGGGVAKWMNGGIAGLSYALTRAMREVLLGEDPPVALSRRAEACLAEQRESDAPDTVHPGGTLITRVGADVR